MYVRSETETNQTPKHILWNVMRKGGTTNIPITAHPTTQGTVEECG